MTPSRRRRNSNPCRHGGPVGPVLLAALSFALAVFSPGEPLAQVCDPPGPPPRFACTWTTDLCDWICPICDPFGAPPRASCHWDLGLCNWVCPGYTGVQVTVQTTGAPQTNATVYVRLSSLCTATGAGAFCNGTFGVSPGMTVAGKCQEIAKVIANACSAAGYAVTTNDCAATASLTASNLGCPATPFALGLSNDSGVFDQTEDRPMPDGETDVVTGSTATCATTPGAVANLRLALRNNGTELELTWDDATNAEDYVIYTDMAANGPFTSVAGTARDGSGWTTPLPPGTDYYLVAGRNAACGVGPKE